MEEYDCAMPEFESLRYTKHALSRMSQRRLSSIDVELTIRSGETWVDDDGLWVFELGGLRVIVREEQEVGIVITAVKLRGQER